jgi:hypothetical protein
MMMCLLFTLSTECFDPKNSSNVQFVHFIIATTPNIVPEFVVHPWRGGWPRVDKQYVHLVCDTSTHVFFAYFGLKCHTLLPKQVLENVTPLTLTSTALFIYELPLPPCQF